MVFSKIEVWVFRLMVPDKRQQKDDRQGNAEQPEQ
jgi:hypothetical protein